MSELELEEREDEDLDDDEELAIGDGISPEMALRLENQRLRSQLDVFKSRHEKMRDAVKEEMRGLISSLIDKHKTLQFENAQLKKQMEQMIRDISLVEAEAAAKAVSNADQLKATNESLKQEIQILNSLIQNLENENFQMRRFRAEADVLRQKVSGTGDADSFDKAKEAQIEELQARLTEARSQAEQSGQLQGALQAAQARIAELQATVAQYAETIHAMETELAAESAAMGLADESEESFDLPAVTMLDESDKAEDQADRPSQQPE